MKNQIAALLLILGIGTSFGQNENKINSSNYYDYYLDFPAMKKKGLHGKILTTNWLRLKEVIPVIIDELKKAGYTDITQNEEVKVNDTQSLTTPVYCKKSNFGFLYIEIHSETPNKKHRIERTQKESMGVDYIDWKELPNGKITAVKIEKLPENIFVLNENCYWYQYTDNPVDSKQLVSKEDAFKIIREDIKAYLLKAPGPRKTYK
ncbi:hypothetical protein NAT51_07975 [Flavobacterium amniphilum]|uniref:hypothetical protein n=1 Tax=Flavobacterium amniphilum TaxID=1834035 RepID=UPI00202A221C|nr:hypothetical protein [Flavobacterium amniphilum]MCL9805455.1 hypothetical protein [Flavobacterium amniphilum]